MTAMPATVPATPASRPCTRPDRYAAAASRQSTAQTATVATPGRPIVGSCTSSKASDSANWAEPVVEVSPSSSSRPTMPISTPTEIRCRRFWADSTRVTGRVSFDGRSS